VFSYHSSKQLRRWNRPDAASGECFLVPLLLLTGQQLLLLLMVKWAAKFSNEKGDILPDKCCQI
jgi:hypothetical protein